MEDAELAHFSEDSAASSLQGEEDMPHQWSDESLDENLEVESESETHGKRALVSGATLSSKELAGFKDEFGDEIEEEEELRIEESACEIDQESDAVCELDESDSDSSVGNVNPISTRKKFTHADKIQTLNLRRNLNQLDGIYIEKELMIQKIREELSACRQRIENLEQHRDIVDREIEAEKAADNIATVFRLRATYRRLCTELGNEEELEAKIRIMLEDHEAELWQIEIEQGRFDNLRGKLQQDEEALERRRVEEADQRLQKQENAAVLWERRQQVEAKKQRQALKERELRHRKAVEDAQRNHEKAVHFLKETMTRVRQKEASEEQKTREDLEKRMQAVLTLKNNISANRENIRVIRARDKARATVAKKQETQAKEAVLAEGGDVTKFVVHQKRLAEFEQQKQEFAEQQQSRKIEILTKILREEAWLEKQKKQPLQSDTRKSSGDKSHGPSKLRFKAVQHVEMAFGEPSEGEPEPRNWRSPSPLSDDGDTEEDERAAEPGEDGVCDKAEEEGESLAQPEFMGLWDQELKPYKVRKDEADSKPLGGSKMEHAMLAETLEKLRGGIVRKQVVSGHEFKGCPFYAKPEIIHFKDFDVGRSYKKKITLTNASYTINFCKLGGVSEHLKDFIAIQFHPPGQMSPGMSCDMVVTFKPMINEDLEGKVMFLAQIGSFSVPISCTTKKCDLVVDKDLIDFGTHVVGETISRTITLTNRGALGTRFKFQTLTDATAPRLAVTGASTGRMTTQELEVDAVEVDGSTSSPDPTARTPEVLQRSPAGQENVQGSPRDRQETDLRPCSIKVMDDLATANQKQDLRAHLVEAVEIRVGEVRDGEISPFGSVKLPVIFTPIIPGKVTADFEIRFDNPDCKPIPVEACGTSMDVPVWVSNPDIDLKICMYDRLYQDSVVVQSRASTALRLKFEVCKELKHHMELLPRTGYVQAQSAFSVQLKFLPRPSLSEDAGALFDKETGVLEVPMTITVADQTRPVPFTVHAIITTSDLDISPAEVDFGYCTIYEAVQTTVQLSNKSILPQEFGFVGIPEFAEIQPNDGFGTLLPLEIMNIDIIFKAAKAKEYSFDLICKSDINRVFKVSCKGVGVHPPLELSQSLVQFSATSLNDVSTATLFVINPHTSRNEFTHPVPRIGQGSIAPVGPTSFEFHPPEDSPITISPAVGTVLPGKKCLVQVSFRPTLTDQAIREEAVRLLCRAVEARAALEKVVVVEAEILSKDKKDRMSAKKGAKKSQSHPSPKETGPKAPAAEVPPVAFVAPKPEEIKTDSDEYAAALASILRSFSGKFERFIVPCFVASCGEIRDPKKPRSLNYSPHNTLYLELHCPAVAPPLVITSDNGKHTINFGEVATGQRVLKKMTVQNISQEPLDLSFSVLNPSGPFLLLSSAGVIEAGGSYVLLIAFSPEENKKFFEHLDICSSKGTVPLSITGLGLSPSLTCSVEGGVLDMGYVLANDRTTATFKLQNTSTFPIKYFIKLSSLSEKRQKDQQKLPPFITPHREATHFVGTQNYSGLSVFSVSPVEGAIDPGMSQDLTVTFSPDHESLYYSDCLRVELVSKQVVHVIRLKGAARNHVMFLEGGDPIDVSVESLTIVPTEDGEPEDQVHPVVLSLGTGAARELTVGCIRTTLPSGKKAVEFSWDGVQALQQKGFLVEPVKGSVEAGQRKVLSVSWSPPAGHDALRVGTAGGATEDRPKKQSGGRKKEQKVVSENKAAEAAQPKISGSRQPNRPLTVTTELTLKGDIIETYRVLITAPAASE